MLKKLPLNLSLLHDIMGEHIQLIQFRVGGGGRRTVTSILGNRGIKV